LFDNMLQYLSESKKEIFRGSVSVSGYLTADDIAELTQANPTYLQSKNNTDVMLAFNGANIDTVKKHAAQGGTVVVLSNDVSSKISQVSIAPSKENTEYIATKINSHDLLSGISSGNFKTTISNGYFTEIPSNAKVLLQGFESTMGLWRIEEAGPIMISIPYGKGEIVLSTIPMDKNASNASKDFLRQLLTNCNVPIAYTTVSPETTTVKKTVPITIDGKLNEWLDDMDDRLVSQYVHAQPVYLTSQETIEGPAAYDLKLSGINYFLWNEEALYVSGVVFSEEKSAMSYIKYGNEKEYAQQIYFNDDVFDIQFKGGNSTVKVNGKTNNDLNIKHGQLDSKYMTDATKLQFSFINGGGEIITVPNLIGETFELMIPWEYVKSKPNKGSSQVLIKLSSKDTKLQLPLSGDVKIKSTWMDFNFMHK